MAKTCVVPSFGFERIVSPGRCQLESVFCTNTTFGFDTMSGENILNLISVTGVHVRYSNRPLFGLDFDESCTMYPHLQSNPLNGYFTAPHSPVIRTRHCVLWYACLVRPSSPSRLARRRRAATSGKFRLNDMSSRSAKISKTPSIAMAGFWDRSWAMAQHRAQSQSCCNF